jgi:hypothetical protein
MRSLGIFPAAGIVLAQGHHPPFTWLGVGGFILAICAIELVCSGTAEPHAGPPKPGKDRRPLRLGKALKNALRRAAGKAPR